MRQELPLPGSDRRLAAAAAAGSALVILYLARTRLLTTPAAWLATFAWGPVSGPASPAGLLVSALDSAAACAAYAAWLALAWLAGRTLLRLLRWSGDALEERVAAAGLGLGLLSLVFFAFGLAGMHTPAGVLAAAIVLCAAAALGAGPIAGPADGKQARAAARPAAASKAASGQTTEGEGRPLQDQPSSPAEPAPQTVPGLRAAAGLAFVALMFHLLGALLPPASFDELNYQLALPKLYVQNQGFIATPYNHLSFLPRNMSMLFTAGLLSGGAPVSKLFSWGMGILASAAVYAFGRRRLGGAAALLAAAAFTLLPVVGNQFRLAAADLGTAFYELTAVFLVLRWLEERDKQSLALSSVFWGLALGTKYTALQGFAAAGCLVAAAAWRRRERLGPALALFSLPALALWSPWLALNLRFSGNPFNPMLSRLIHSSNFMFAGEYLPLVDYTSRTGIENYFPLAGPLDLPALPWSLFVRHTDFNHDLGPILLGLAPLAVLGMAALRARKPADRPCPGQAWTRGLAVLAGLYWLMWLAAGVRMARYFTAGLGLTTLLAGWLAAEAFSGKRRGSLRPWLAMAPVLFAMLHSTLRVIRLQNEHKKPWGRLAGRTTERDYVNGVLRASPYDACDFVNRRLPEDAKVLVVDEFRVFYLSRDFLASTPWDHDYWHEAVRLSPDGGRFLERLKGLGVTHVLINDFYVADNTGRRKVRPWTAEDLSKEARFRAECLRPLFRSGGVWVAALNPARAG